MYFGAFATTICKNELCAYDTIQSCLKSGKAMNTDICLHASRK
jgi:hypothetical protein